MKQQQALVVVSLTGLDEALLQRIPARHVYHPEEILFDKRFADILKPMTVRCGWSIRCSLMPWLKITCRGRRRSLRVPTWPSSRRIIRRSLNSVRW